MSRYEWESGSVVIPADQWATFRKDVIKRHNTHQDRLFERAKALHHSMKMAAHGKRGQTRRDALAKARHSFFEQFSSGSERYAVERRVQWAGEFLTPKKKRDFPHLPLSKDCRIADGELSVSLINKSRKLVWEVDENNHAREEAERSWLGRFVLQRLSSVAWKRGSGGIFTGNDEYNRDNRDAGEGKNYVTRRFGPAGKEA